MNIGIIGSPSSGKSTLARSLTSAIATLTRKKVEYTDEFATEFIGRFKKNLATGFPDVQDQYLIAQKQLQKEIDRQADILITDSPIFLSWIYAQRYYNPNNAKDVFFLNEVYLISLNNINRYDHIFFCPTGAFESQSKTERLHTEDPVLMEIENQIKGFLQAHRLQYSVLESPDLGQRVKQILGAINIE